MNGTPRRKAMVTSSPASRVACSGLSMTHGPAIRANRRSPPMARSPIATGFTPPIVSGDGCGRSPRATLRLVPAGGADEAGEERMRARRPGLELGMELDGQIPGMARQLGDLDELAVWRSAGDPQPVLDERAFVRAVELVAVTMTLVDQMDAVYALGERAWRELAGVAAKAHGAAEVVDTQQVSQLVNHFGRRVRGALGRIGIGQAGDM